ncbi:MAG: hypothetical protein JNK87_08340 [Bryobacterales bacterium]|nr:hypothetical protein [Bryobacterales bacterium]
MSKIILAFLEILTLELPVALVDRPYQPEPIRVAGGFRCTVNNIGMSVVLGELPPGLVLSGAGYLRGTPTKMGNYTFAIRAANDCAWTTQAYTLRVDAAPLLASSVERLEFRWRHGGPMPAPQAVTVGSNRVGLAYEVQTIVPWLRAEALRGRTPGAGSAFQGDPVTVLVDPAKLAPGVYRTELVLTAWDAVERLRIPVVLVVDAQ